MHTGTRSSPPAFPKYYMYPTCISRACVCAERKREREREKTEGKREVQREEAERQREELRDREIKGGGQM